MVIAKVENDGNTLLILGLNKHDLKMLNAGKRQFLSDESGAPKGALPDNLGLMLVGGESDENLVVKIREIIKDGQQRCEQIDTSE